jgi:hypothetical protein
MFNFIEPICCYKKGFADPFRVSYNGYRLGEVAEHKTSLELQMFKLR